MKSNTSNPDNVRTSGKSKLLMSVAAGALFCLMAAPANADCVLTPDGADLTAVCSGSSGGWGFGGWSSVDLSNSGDLPGGLNFEDVAVVAVTDDAGAAISTITADFTGTNTGDSFTLTNAGTVSGATSANLFDTVAIDNSGSLADVSLTNSGTAAITNSGSLAAVTITDIGSATITNEAGATISSITADPGLSFTLTNAGTVPGTTSVDAYDTVSISNSGSLADLSLTNNGDVTVGNTATGTMASIFADTGNTFALTNGGTVSGTTNVDWFDSASVTNTGTLGGVTIDDTGAITVANSVSGTISWVDARGIDSTTITNAGTIGGVYFDTYTDSTSATTGPTFVSGTGLTTAGYTDEFSNYGADVSVTNSGTVTNSIDGYSADATVDNSGEIGGSIWLAAANSWGRDNTQSFTETYLDSNGDGTGFIADSDGDGYYDSFTSTDTQTWTAWGGDAAITNSGSVGSYVYANAAGTIDLTNSGDIGDWVTFSTLDGWSGNVATEEQVATVSESDDGINASRTTTTDFSRVWTGGAITADNSGSIGGDFNAEGADDIALTNSGSINGSVTLNASVQDETSNSQTVNTEKVTPASTTTTSVTDPATPPNATTDTTTWLDYDDAYSYSYSYTNTQVSSGGAASLTNADGATIGVDGSLVSVEVMGDTSAAIENVGTIYGMVAVAAEPVTETSFSGNANNSYSSYGGQSVTVTTDDGTNPAYVSSSSDVTESTSGSGYSWYNGQSTVYDPAGASLDNSGTITGWVTVTGTGAASIDNSGTIGGSISIANLGNSSSESAYSYSDDTAARTDYETTASYSGSDFLWSYSSAVTNSETEAWVSSSSSASASIGGSAALTNQTGATIGADGAPVSVSLSGQASATVTNDGTIFGDVAVASAEYANVSSNSSNETDTTHSSTTVSGDFVNTDNTHFVYSISSDSTGTGISESASSMTYSGGASALVNTSSDSIHGDVEVAGVESATLDNSGLITGNVTVTARATDTASSYSHPWSSSSSSSLNLDTTTAYDATYDMPTEVVDSVESASTSHYEYSTDQTNMSSEAGGDAVLTNSADGVVGAEGALVSIDVEGGQSASVTNDGALYGTVRVYANYQTAFASASNSTYVSDSSTSGSSIDTAEYEIVADTSTTPATPYSLLSTETIETHSSLSSSVAQTSDSSYGRSYTVGDASFSNSGTVGDETTWTYVDVYANATATIGNTGTIYGDLNAGAGGGEYSYASSSTSGNSATSTDDTVTVYTYDVDDTAFTSTLAMTAYDRASTTANSSYSTSDSTYGYSYDIGDITASNAVSGVVAGNVWIGSDNSSTLSNAGEIGGDVTVRAWNSVFNQETKSSYQSTENTASGLSYTIDAAVAAEPTVIATGFYPYSTYDLTDERQTSYDNAYDYSNAYGSTAGDASFDNSGLVGGDVYLYGNTSAALDNSGEIDGDVWVGATQGYSYADSRSWTDVGSSETTQTQTATGTPAYDPVTNVLTSLVFDGTGQNTYAETETYSEQTSTTETYSGGEGTLNNRAGGVIGVEFSPVTVDVEGYAGASVINNGDIYGDVSASSEFTNYANTYTRDYVYNYGETNDSAFLATLTNTYLSDGVTLDTTEVHETLTETIASAGTTTEIVTGSEAYTAAGGDVTYTGTGNLFGSLSQSSFAGDVALNNNGWIGRKLFGGETISLSANGTDTASAYTQTVTTLDENNEVVVSEDGVVTSDTGTRHQNTDEVYSSTSSTTPVGGTASLINARTATIGGFIDNGATILVSGFSGASAQNSGTINGSVTVASVGKSTSDTYDYASNDDIVTQYDHVTGAYIETEAQTASSKDVYVDPWLGGTASVTNTGTLTGDVAAYGVGGAYAANTGNVYGDVDLASGYDPSNGTYVDQTVTTTSASGVTTVTDFVDVDNYSVGVQGLVDTETMTDFATAGGDASLSNAGTIGLKENDLNGIITVSGGNVSLYANGDVSVANTHSGIIYGDVDAQSYGYSGSSDVTSAREWDASTVFVDGDRTYTLSETDTTASASSGTYGGGTVTFTNAGTIGKNYASTDGSVTGVGGVYLYGGESVTANNSGTIGGDLVADAYGWQYASSSSDVTTYDIFESDTATDTSLVTETESSSYTSTATGGTAAIDNSGSIGVNILNDYGAYSPSQAAVLAYGDAGATITNSGTIQGRYVYAASDTQNYSYDYSGSSSVYSENGILMDRSDSSTETTSYQAAGGSASIDNSGSILADEGGSMYVTAEGYAGATVTNSGTIDGGVSGGVRAYSYGWDSIDTIVSEETSNDFGLVSSTDNETLVETVSGGTAAIENTGTIDGYVYANGYSAGTVENSGTISGSVYANSAFSNYSLNSTVSLTGPTSSIIDDSFVETYTETGGAASIDNSGIISGPVGASAYTTASIGNTGNIFGSASLNSLFVDQVNNSGDVTETYVGGTSELSNSGEISGTFSITSFGGSTFTNMTDAVIDEVGGANQMLTYDLGGTNTLTNRGTIGGAIVFTGNTAAYNYGTIGSDLTFRDSDAGASAASFTFESGSVLGGDIYNYADSLTLNLDGSGSYGGNVGFHNFSVDIDGASATNKTGSGVWVLSGDYLDLGTTTISAGTLWTTYEGADVIADITVANGAMLESTANVTGSVTNSGTVIAGYLVSDNTSNPLSSLLDNSGAVQAGTLAITGSYTQTSNGTLVTNAGGAVSRNAATQVTGTSNNLFGLTTYALNEGPFTADNTNSAKVEVTGDATVAGTVLVYVDKDALYVDGTKTQILSATGSLSNSATAQMSESSLFVSYGLETGTSGSKKVLNAVVKRTSYSSVAENTNQTAIGLALDSAVPDVATQIAADNFSSVAEYNQVEDMAGFLTDMDWRVTSASQAQQIIAGLSPEGYANLAAIDTGIGFNNVLQNHLRAFADAGSFGLWGRVYGVGQSISGDNGVTGLNGMTAGISAGFDVSFDNVLLGIAGGYARTTFDTPNRSFHGSETSYQAGIYGKATFDQLYVDAAIWGNFGTGKATRDLGLVDRIATSSYDPNEFRFDLDAGYRFVTGDNIGITPYVALSYRNAKIDDIAEVGAGGLGYNLTDLGGSFVKPSLGVTVDSEWSLSTHMKIRPLAGIGVEFQPKADGILAQFQGGGDAFSISSAYGNEVAFKPEAGFDLVVGDHLSLQVGYVGAIGKNGSTNGGWFGLRGNW